MAYLVVSHLLCKYIKHQQLTASAVHDGGYVHAFSSGRKNKSRDSFQQKFLSKVDLLAGTIRSPIFNLCVHSSSFQFAFSFYNLPLPLLLTPLRSAATP